MAETSTQTGLRKYKELYCFIEKKTLRSGLVPGPQTRSPLDFAILALGLVFRLNEIATGNSKFI